MEANNVQHRIDHVEHVVVAHASIERKTEHAGLVVDRDGKAIRQQLVFVAIVRMQVNRNEMN